MIPNDSINSSGGGVHSSNSWSTGYGSGGGGDPGINSGAVEETNLVENSDGSMSATISVPNNVILILFLIELKNNCVLC